MITYQDLLKVGKSEDERQKFLVDAINAFKASEEYRQAIEAEKYASGQNVLISKYQKFLYTITGEQVPDNYTANHKMKSALFKRHVTQLASYLLGNGLICKKNAKNHDKLGEGFDKNLYFYGKSSLATACSYGFWNVDHVEDHPCVCREKFVKFSLLRVDILTEFGASFKATQAAILSHSSTKSLGTLIAHMLPSNSSS